MDDKDAFQLLRKLVSAESVSTDPSRKKQMMSIVAMISGELEKIGAQVSLFQKDGSWPLIVGKLSVNTNFQTAGIYAHYDVQPEDPIDRWKSPPFKLTRIAGKFFGRGSADDKGHLVQSIAGIKRAVDKKRLNKNIVFIFEGEEENESAHFEELVKKAGPILKTVDSFYVFDTGMLDKKTPQIYYGLRGIVAFELEIMAGNKDLHSGIFGNRVVNPAQAAAGLFSKMKHFKTGRILVPGFYDGLKKFSSEEIAFLTKNAPDIEKEKKETGVFEFTANFLKSKIEPSLDINGISGGYTGQGFKTVIPSSVTVKFSVRLVEYQDPEDVKNKIENFVRSNISKKLKYRLKSFGGSAPFFTDFKNPIVQETARALEKVFEGRCRFNRSGGSIGATEIFQRVFGKPVILTGFTLPDQNLHAPNENIDSEMFFKGIKAIEKIFSL